MYNDYAILIKPARHRIRLTVRKLREYILLS